MNADGKSDDFIVPAKRGNKTGTPAADLAEERESPKGSVIELSSMFRTLSRFSASIGATRSPRQVATFGCDRLT